MLNRPDLFDLLIDLGANINQRNMVKQLDSLFKKHIMITYFYTFKGYFPLHIAVSESLPDMINAILSKNGVIVDAIDKDGRTAVMLAAGQGKHDLVKVLINAGADINKSDFVRFNRNLETMIMSYCH